MIHISRLITNFMNIIFYLIILSKIISSIIVTYYFIVFSKIKYVNPKIMNQSISMNVSNITEIYNRVNSILGLFIAVICIILFNPFYIIDYKLDDNFKHMLYYYGLIVVYDSIIHYFTTNYMLAKFMNEMNP